MVISHHENGHLAVYLELNLLWSKIDPINTLVAHKNIFLLLYLYCIFKNYWSCFLYTRDREQTTWATASL